LVSNPPVSRKLGLVAQSCNTATGGKEYLYLNGGMGLVSFLEGWFWCRSKTNDEKEALSL
jgi:hypothetical protein